MFQSFSTKQGRYQHVKKYCKAKKNKNAEENLVKELKKDKEEMKRLLKEKDEQIKAIMEHMEKLLEKVGNTTNNITQTNNIQLNNYGKENTKYIKEDYFIKLLNAPFNSIPKLVRKIHFNKNIQKIKI